MSKRFLSGINVTGTATLNTVANAGLDTDKFLVLDAAGNIDFRTGDELKIDIGANVVSRIEHEVKLGETMSIGTPVYVGVDLNAGTNMTVYKASNATEARSSKTMGLVASSGITNDLVEVITEGLLEGLNTSTATKGDPVWLGVDGALIFGLANKPVAPAHLVSLGVVTRVQQNNGEIFVKVQNGFEMNEIHNYLEGSVQNNQVIVYESATSLYKPKTIPTILGYTPVPNSRTLTINGTTYDLTADRSWTISANQNARTEYEFTTNGSTATYSATYTVGQVDVFYNGSKLSSAEFTATNGTSVTLAFTPPTGQMVEIVAWETGGGVSNGRTLTINGTSYDLSADRSWTVTDSSKLPLSGGTLTGALNGTSALFTDNLRTDTGLGLKYGSFVSTAGYLNLFSALVGSTYTLNLKNGTSGYETSLSFNNNANRTYTFPNTNGTIALLESTNIFSGFNWFVGTAGIRINYGIGMTKGTVPDSVSSSWVNVYSDSGDKNLVLIDSFTSFAKLQFQNTGNLTYTFPASSGTVALTSNLSSYLPLTGGTLTGALSGTSATFNSFVYILGGNPLRIYNTGNGDFGNLTFATATGFTFDKGITSTAASGFIGAYSTNPASDAAIGAYWSGTSGLEIRYNPNSAIGYIQSLYPVVSGQPFGDIEFRQSVGGTLTTRMIIKNDGGGRIGIGTTGPNNLLSVRGNADFGATGYSYVGPAQYGVLMFPRGQILFSNTNTQNQMYITSNAYINSGGSFAYRNTSQPATAIGLDNGGMTFLTAGNGTADANISFTAAMGITNAGQVTKPKNPAFRAYYSVNNTWSLGGGVTFVFDTTEYNIGSCYNTSNGRFTAPVAGVYQFNFYTIVLGNYLNAVISFRKNGGAPTSGFNVHFSPYYTSTGWSNVVYTTSLYLNDGDYVYMVNGGDTTNYHGDDWSSFSGYLVG